MNAKAELDLTDFGTKETFQKLLDKHGLEYSGVELPTELEGVELPGVHVWSGEEVRIHTTCNPLTGEHTTIEATQDLGWASFVTIMGEEKAAADLYCDVLCTAKNVKGEIDPLMTDNGRVIASTTILEP
ncbi:MULTISPECIES: hypothetical protein [Natrialbaceae]|uniref:hypothetical protein n=1 Tax=Natrialbaceae TaxID=1644061 RepID=UPI00207C4612|nr:hypothetical protein [Natronococcus sp. CG52]